MVLLFNYLQRSERNFQDDLVRNSTSIQIFLAQARNSRFVRSYIFVVKIIIFLEIIFGYVHVNI